MGMGFGCTIKLKNGTELTAVSGGGGKLSYKLYGLGPSSCLDSAAPYSVEDFRRVVTHYHYADRLPAAAQDCFREIQAMASANLSSIEPKHCESCTCPAHTPSGWSAAEVRSLLAIDPGTIKSISGGY